MRLWRWVSILAVVLGTGFSSLHAQAQSLTPERAAAVEKDVRAYAGVVAHDVTSEGPAAWSKHLADSPSFFLASEGRLVFADGASAAAGIQGLTRSIKHIELQWGDVRVDPLTPELAVMAASYHEIRVDNAGKQLDESGYFTAVVQYRDGRWQFRNTHWSVAPPASEVH